MTSVHVARFGERAGEHALLGHTGANRDLLTEAQFRSDLPPQGDSDTIGTFVTGYRLEDKFVVQRTTPDHAATRPGMVSTTSVLLPLKLVGAISLEIVFDYLVGDPDVADPVDPALFRARGGPHAHPPGAAALASALLAARRAIWPDGVGLQDAIACLWRHLPEGERHRLTFGAAFHPGAINVPIGSTELVALSVPATVASRWQDWPIIDPSQPVRPDPVRDAFFGGDDAVHALAHDLLGRDIAFEELRHLVNIADLERRLDTLDHERLRSLLQLVGLVASGPTAGRRLKARVLARLGDLTTTGAAFDDVRGLRGVPWSALPAGAARDLIGPWAAGAVTEATRLPDVADAISEITTGSEDDYRDQLDAALRDALAAADGSSWRRVAGAALDRGDEAVAWLIGAAPKPAVVDAALAAAVDDAAGSPPPWIAALALTRRLPATHARSVDTSDPIGAWRAHVVLKRRPADADAALARRVGAPGTVAAALALDDSSLMMIAADFVAATPTLLAQWFDIADRRARALWAEATARGADPWTVVSPADARSALLDALLADDAPDPLLDLLSQTAAADLSSYPRRPQVWPKLQAGPRARMLSATANALGRRWRSGDPPVEPSLAEAILDRDRLGAIAHDDPAHAVHLVANLTGAKPEHAVVTAQRGRFDASTAAELGDLVVTRRWKRAAESITDLAESRADLKPVVSRVAGLFSTLEKLRRWAGMSDGVRGVVTRGELRDALHDLAALLYSAGPTDRGLWERAGGHNADCPDAATARHRWGLALAAIAEEHKGAPTLDNLLGVMTEEYPHNRDLQHLADAMLTAGAA